MIEKYVPWTRERQSAANEYVPWVRPTAKENRYVPFYSSARSGNVLNNIGVFSSNNVVAGPRIDCLDTKYLTSVIPSPKGVTTVDTRFLWPEMFEWSKASCPKWFHGFHDDTYIRFSYASSSSFEMNINLGKGLAILKRTFLKSDGQSPVTKDILIAKRDGFSVYGSVICPTEIGNLRGCSDLLDHVFLSVENVDSIIIYSMIITLNYHTILELYFDNNSGLLKRGDILDIDTNIYSYRRELLGLRSNLFINGILDAAVRDYRQSWSPKYGNSWDKVNGSWMNTPHEWCSEFAAYCIRKGTMNYSEGPLCNPNEIFRNLDFSTPWTFGTNISVQSMRTYFQNCGRFICPKDYYYLDENDKVVIVPRTEYSELGGLITQGFYLSQVNYNNNPNEPEWDEFHSVLFIDWVNGFNPSRDALNTFRTIERAGGVIIRERTIGGPDYMGHIKPHFSWPDPNFHGNIADKDLYKWSDDYQSYILTGRYPINGFGNTKENGVVR